MLLVQDHNLNLGLPSYQADDSTHVVKVNSYCFGLDLPG
ncbi:unnamed protein product [Acidithrix sp. C25]|nr:unnamed protein product [Acidithrix sp. C25]